MNSVHVYEGLFILNSDVYGRNPEEVSGQISKTIESLGGEVRVSRLWEERKLAYPIKSHRRGAYWLTYFRLSTDKLSELNRQFRLNGNVLRFLILTIDPRLEEPLVEHALNGPAKPEQAEAEVPGDAVYDDDDNEEGEEESEN